MSFAGVGVDEKASCLNNDPKYFRPTEVDLLLGDPTKAENINFRS